MDSRDFCQLASRLAALPKVSPAEARTAIGRAYYGAFNHAVSALESMNAGVPRNAAAHIDSYRLFRLSGDDALVDAGGLLDELHGLRNRADYRLAPSPSVESRFSAMKAVKDADQVFTTIDAVLNDPARLTAVSAQIREKYQEVTSRPLPP